MKSSPKKVAFVFGTRPEAIKLCPLILRAASSNQMTARVCLTGQHRQMLDQVLDVFSVKPDFDLELMLPNQTLAQLTARAVAAIDRYLAEDSPALVVVQGDTTTAFCAALAAFYRRIPVAHVEAGLRTFDRLSPFPEEINRVFISQLATWHFAPTALARQNLLKDRVPDDRIAVTGNTVIDALQIAVQKVRTTSVTIPGLPHSLAGTTRRMVLITAHRRENFGGGIESICQAVAELAVRFPDVDFVYPVHLNPNVRDPVGRMLKDFPNVYLIEPVTYLPFVTLMDRAAVILTDSGGVQEEAPSLGKPVLVMRDTTERPEAVEAGTVKLVGTSRERIISTVSTLLTDATAYEAMARATNPYGDGRACERIMNILSEQL